MLLRQVLYQLSYHPSPLSSVFYSYKEVDFILKWFFNILSPHIKPLKARYHFLSIHSAEGLNSS